MISKNNYIVVLLLIAIFTIAITSCKRNIPKPKPYVYFRIDLPQKDYQRYEGDCPFSFDFPTYSFLIEDSLSPCWMNVYFPYNKATIYLTYKELNNDLSQHMEDSREFVYKHTVKADAIDETFYEDDSNNVYGILYEIKGNAASSLQFFVTDSTNHFIRGALYFDVRPNKDSLDPVIRFIREDIVHLFESIVWE